MIWQGVKAVVGFWVAVVLTAAVLALWGFGHRLFATLLPGLAAGLDLAPAEADMARAAIAMGYFLMTLPGAFITRNFGYKIGMIFGLGVFAVGTFLLYPAIERHSLSFFLMAATVFGSGLAILGVTTTPFVVFLGSRNGAIQRAILAEALSPLGGLAALLIGRSILTGATFDPSFAHNMVGLFSAVGVAAITLAFVIEMTKFPPAADARIARDDRTLPSFLAPLRIARFRYAIAAIFLCLFAQIIIANFAPRYAVTVMPSLPPGLAHQVLVWGYVALLAGRIAGPILMLRIAPMRLLVAFSALATLCIAVAVVGRGPVAIASLIGAAFFLSIIIPTITADAIADLGEMAKSAAALLQFVAFTGTGIFALLAIAVTAQIVPLVMVLPALCLAAITVLSLCLCRPGTADTAPPVSAGRAPAARPIGAAAVYRPAVHPERSAAAENCPG